MPLRLSLFVVCRMVRAKGSGQWAVGGGREVDNKLRQTFSQIDAEID